MGCKTDVRVSESHNKRAPTNALPVPSSITAAHQAEEEPFLADHSSPQALGEAAIRVNETLYDRVLGTRVYRGES